ncbi:ester cyclase [Microlunatus antarcticus]|uniref:Ester cyclase n=1 Tax=Microlunatus antarcticus TaxID=53388 RepID=A0A7W5JYL4_9ACTN|nr:ester cyclase [Microlunatus antarcticus]MBB3328709.1 hypothetical protein [Microlunatus antarcticus]
MATDRKDLVSRYERYLAYCNERRFDELGEFVADDVSGSGADDGLSAYVDRINEIFVGFPDFRWTLQDLLVEGSTIVARLVDEGTHTGLFGDVEPTGRQVRVQELVVYRWAEGKIVQCWGDLYAVVRDELRSPAHLTR